MQYFKHMGTMRNDVKIRRLINKYGLEGYGLYNLILESITEKLTTESPIPNLQETCEDIAEFYNGNTAKINEITNFMINQGLFELDEISGNITCNKLYKFLEQNQTRSKEIRAMIAEWKKKIPEQIEYVSDGLETVEDKSEEQNRTEQNRTEKEQNRTEKENEIFKFIIDGFYQYHNKQYRFTDKETGIAKRISIDLAKYDNWDDILKAKINGLKKKVDLDKKEFWSFTISKLEYGWNEFTEIKRIESSNQTDAIINYLKDKGYGS